MTLRVCYLAFVVRRIIENRTAVCENKECKMVVSRSYVKNHEMVCQHRVFECCADECEFKGKKKEFLDHLTKEHSDDIVQNAPLCFEPYVTFMNSYYNDRIDVKENERGRTARIGKTGKYYCKGPLEYPCNCCRGTCGPLNGCNCQVCMELDITSRKLPEGYLVNRDGATCRKSNETELFYCGRMLNSVQYCGPNKGESCQECAIIQDQCDTRYADIWK